MANKNTKLNIVVDAEDRTKGAFRNLDSQLGNTNRNLGGITASAAKLVAGFYAVKTAFNSVSGFLRTGFGVAADLETAQVGLSTLLGSTEKAAATIERLKIEAARTPFELPGLTQATQLLSSVTKDGDRSIDILLDVGEGLAAMGKGQAELDRIIVNLQQIAAVGRASAIDIKQFAFAGIPIYEMLAETTGQTGEALATMIKDGEITFELLTNMFDEANNAGGRFFNAFQNQSGTFNQSLSNLKDSFGIFAADFVKNTGAFDGLIRVMTTASDIIQNYEHHIARTKERLGEFFSMIDKKTGLISLFNEVWANTVYMFQTRLKPAIDELKVAMAPLQPFLDALVQVLGTGLVVAVGAIVIALGTLAVGLIEILTWATKVADFLFGTLSAAFDWITDKIAGSIDVVEKFVGYLKDAVDLIGDIPSNIFEGAKSIIGVDDAVISPDGKVISTHPDDYIIATKDPSSLAYTGSGAFIVNINGGNYLSEDAAEGMGDLILNRLKLSNAI